MRLRIFADRPLKQYRYLFRRSCGATQVAVTRECVKAAPATVKIPLLKIRSLEKSIKIKRSTTRSGDPRAAGSEHLIYYWAKLKGFAPALGKSFRRRRGGSTTRARKASRVRPARALITADFREASITKL
ncbi:hypothetical protein EVAR_41751_1 [Eumeta japonica]|uniref:Uncharacterized protein n=1 Tax=Eumeta variegata TaxID=151549 RepID=A0A4C1W1G0_EUMVA|nr:hypothetical protein EVAR_41751_1 [Eumeta japonica]